MHCTDEAHDAARRDPDCVRGAWEFVGVSDWEFVLFEQYNCPTCRSTFSIPGIGPTLPRKSPPSGGLHAP